MLQQYEDEQLSRTDFAALALPSGRLGSDPCRILRFPENKKYLVLLRNRSVLLALDESYRILQILDTPRSPSGWSLSPDGYLFVSGEEDDEIALFQVTGEGVRRIGEARIPGESAIRDVAYADRIQSLFYVEEFRHRLAQLILDDGWRRGGQIQFRRREIPVGVGPFQVRVRGNSIMVNSLLSHTIHIIPFRDNGDMDTSRTSQITHDGPIWSFDACETPKGTILCLGGVENRPLDRTGGEFGWIDSVLYLYRVPPGGPPREIREINLSAYNLVTPKIMTVTRETSGGIAIDIPAFGSPLFARFHFAISDSPVLLSLDTWIIPPGTTDFVKKEDRSIVSVNPLLDGLYELPFGDSPLANKFVSLDPVIPHQEGENSSARTMESRLGEWFFFTTLLTPSNRPDGSLSRFTCEACHFEGYVDGRTHYTGRGHVHATTKPLRGLVNNRPFFSRALDPTFTRMVQNEFRVANQNRLANFLIDRKSYRGLENVPGVPELISPLLQRKALMRFLMDFNHRPNPHARLDGKLSPAALEGADVFEKRCAACHRPAESTEPSAKIARRRDYESWIVSPARSTVWAAPFYRKTGVTPYVHAEGCRVPGLRRLYKKWPYFTNGSAKTLLELLDRFRYSGSGAWHGDGEEFSAEPAPQGTALTESEKRALVAFLEYL